MPCTKSQIIYGWKKQGLIYDDYDDLYEIYIKTMKCDCCNKEFKNSKDRCLDHDHETGRFRAIVCQKCNIHDSYIKYPNGYDSNNWQKQYNLTHREDILKWQKEKTTCICGDIVSKNWKSKHLKTQKHLNSMDKYMNNVD